MGSRTYPSPRGAHGSLGRDDVPPGACRENAGMEARVGEEQRSWTAAAADVAVLVVFVLVGRRSHHEDSGLAGFARVLWPFVVGLAVAWVATGLWRAPLAWRRASAAWLLTVAVGMAVRVVAEGRDFSVAFTVVTLLFVGAGMVGWRAIARRRRARTAFRP
jgi:hypothetical protein